MFVEVIFEYIRYNFHFVLSMLFYVNDLFDSVRSVIDDLPLDGIESIRLHSAADYAGAQCPRRAVRWTEVFFLPAAGMEARPVEPVDASRLAETLAAAGAMALTPHLDALKQAGNVKIALRVNIDSENVSIVGVLGNRMI